MRGPVIVLSVGEVADLTLTLRRLLDAPDDLVSKADALRWAKRLRIEREDTLRYYDLSDPDVAPRRRTA